MKIRWPWMTKKQHSRIMNETIRYYRRKIGDLETMFQEEREEILDPMLKNRIEFRGNRLEDGRYRICVGLDTLWVESSWVHGNSTREQESIAAYLSSRLTREIMTLLRTRNFIRLGK